MQLAQRTRDILASLVVFLVALPLCIGVAIASGVPPAMGLVSGIIGGLVVGSLAGSPLQVSGPAAGLAVIVYEIVTQHGLAALAPVVVLAGLLQMLAGRLQLGRWLRAVAPPVVHAMLAGIGVLILGGQLHVLFDAAPSAGGLDNYIKFPGLVLDVLFGDLGAQLDAGIAGATALVLIGVWNRVRAKSTSILRTVPAALVAVIGATAVTQLFGLELTRVTVPSVVSELIAVPDIGIFARLLEPAVLLSSVALFVIASAEGLLCAAAVDRLHEGAASDLDKELFAQGAGNLFAGILGGLPVTGVIVRSTANIDAGATSRVSAVLHGLWLIGFVLVLPHVLQLIPVAALAAILVSIGWKLIDVDVMRDLLAKDRGDLAVYAITLGAIVLTSLLYGLAIGVVASMMRLAWTASHLEIEISETDEFVEVDLLGAGTFVRVPELAGALRGLPKGRTVRIHFEHLDFIDHAVLELVEDWEQEYERLGGKVLIAWHELRQRTDRRLRRAA